jgi:hypothetical protein
MGLCSARTSFGRRAARVPAALAISKMRRTEVCRILMLRDSAA